MLGDLQGIIVGVIAAIFGVVMVWLRGKSKGRSDATNEKRIEDYEQASEVRRRVDASRELRETNRPANRFRD